MRGFAAIGGEEEIKAEAQRKVDRIRALAAAGGDEDPTAVEQEQLDASGKPYGEPSGELQGYVPEPWCQGVGYLEETRK